MAERTRNLIVQGCPPEFYGDGDDLDTIYIPVRGLQVALGKENSLVVLPDAVGVREFVSGSEEILNDVRIQNPENIIVPDADYFLDRALELSLDLLTEKLNPGDRHILWPYANTEVSDGWVNSLRSRGFKIDNALPRKDYKPYQTRSAWGRRMSSLGEPSFPERYEIPYPISFVAKGLAELEEAYEMATSLSGRNSAYLKLAASAGGFGLARVESVDDVRRFYSMVKTDGQLYLMGNLGMEQDIEVQEEIPDIVGFGSFQYLGSKLQTPGGISLQLLNSNNWVGNKFNVVNGVLSRRALDIFNNFSNGMKQEHPEGACGWGGVDVAIVQLGESTLDLVVVENNWGRITGAHPGIYFSEALGVSDRPFLVRKLTPPKVDAKECWRMLKSEKISFDPSTKRGAIPFPWVKEVDAFIFVAGESDREITELSERVMNLTIQNGYH